MAVLQLHDLTFQWPHAGKPVLVIDALAIQAGTRLFIQGPSGCGKSTLLGLLAGVLLPTSGSLQFMGNDWHRLRPGQRDRFRADHIGYIFQQFNLIPYLNAVENVVAPCHFSSKRYRSATQATGSPWQAATRLLDAIGLSKNDQRAQARELSVGQQQRIAAARALIGQPDLIIADEPTSALDEAHRDAFMHHVLTAVENAGSTLIFVSHDQRLASRFTHHLKLPDINRAAHPSHA
ncbi:MAG: ATP-binding cassette domain-containing protein [Alcaligenaceae bacterium]|nr:ATP-binding cassette domain-containing protein [Alcaligenaceae bacterium]